MEYLTDGKKYLFSYQDLKEDYQKFSEMSDVEFVQNISKILHFACFVGYFKGFGNEVLGDEGIIHQLVHVLCGTEDVPLEKVRKQFSMLALV